MRYCKCKYTDRSIFRRECLSDWRKHIQRNFLLLLSISTYFILLVYFTEIELQIILFPKCMSIEKVKWSVQCNVCWVNLRLSIIIEQLCVSCGKVSNFMAQDRTRVSLKYSRVKWIWVSFLSFPLKCHLKLIFIQTTINSLT